MFIMFKFRSFPIEFVKSSECTYPEGPVIIFEYRRNLIGAYTILVSGIMFITNKFLGFAIEDIETTTPGSNPECT